MDKQVHQTARDVDEAERSRHLASVFVVDIVRHAGMLAPDHIDTCTLNSVLVGNLLRNLQPVKPAEQRADVME